MSGIFDYLNRPGLGETERAMNPSFVCGVLVRRAFGLSTAAELIALMELSLGASGPLDSTARSELLAIYNWFNAGAGTEGKAARLSLLCDILGLYEQAKPDGSPWLTEAEARQALTAVGVVFA